MEPPLVVSEPPESYEPPAARRALGRGFASAGLGLLVMVVAFVWIARAGPGTEALVDLWRGARPVPLVVSGLVMTGAYWCMGLRWRALMPPGNRATGRGLAAIVCAGLLLNYAVPGPMGELGAAWFAHRRYRMGLADALASGVVARTLGLATALLLAGGVGLVADLPVPAEYHGVAAAAAGVMGAVGVSLAAVAVRPRWWEARARGLLGWLSGPGRIGRLVAHLDRAVASLTEALAAVTRRGGRAYAVSVGWAFAAHLTVTAGIWIGAWGLGAHPTLPGIVFTYATTTAGSVALFALPGSQVGWDAMFFGLLIAVTGLAAPDAMGITILVRLQQLASMGIGAAALGWLLRDASKGESSTKEPARRPSGNPRPPAGQ